MTYIRTESGAALAKVQNSLSREIMDNVKGYFTEKNFTTGKRKVFVFTEDMALSLGSGQATLMLCIGYYLDLGN